MKKNNKTKVFVNPLWDKDEVESYKRFAKTGTVEQLAYTAVQEAYNARKKQEELEEKEKHIVFAMKKISIGIYKLQELLGFDINRMARKAIGEELDALIREKSC